MRPPPEPILRITPPGTTPREPEWVELIDHDHPIDPGSLDRALGDLLLALASSDVS
jgi:hypothetical protein